MKKLMTLIIVILSVSIFAGNVQNINGQKSSQKGWADYSGSPAWIWSEPGERAMYYNVEDFGMEYPVDFYAVQALLYQDNVDYHFKIYDKDGSTLLWESADSVSAKGVWQMTEVATPLVLADDFWLVLAGSTSGGPVPNTVVDTGDGGYGAHSYTGTAGAWTSIAGYEGYGETGMNYNHSMLAYLEPDPTDIFPPLPREVTGTSNFMDTPAPISVRIIDPNDVVSASGEWTIDYLTWTPFALTESKSSHNFTGVVPGQVDGASGAIRFIAADSLGNSGTSSEYPISWSKDNAILDEGFEGSFVPSGWSLNTSATGAGFIKSVASDPNGSIIHSGNACASHGYDAVDNDDWLISPAVNIPNTNFTTLSFWQAGYWADYIVEHEVAISTDGGGTWTQIYFDNDALNPDVSETYEQNISFLMHTKVKQ